MAVVQLAQFEMTGGKPQVVSLNLFKVGHSQHHSKAMKIQSIVILASLGLMLAGCASPQNHPPRVAKLPTTAPSPAESLLIISATYGSGTNFTDVTCRVNDLLRQPETVFYARPEWLLADPTPGWNKALVIVYELNGRRQLYAAGEGGAVSAEGLIYAPAQKAGRHGKP